MADPCLTGDEGAGYQPGIGQLITGMDDGRYAAAVRTSCVVACARSGTMIREFCKQARGLVDTFSASKGLLPHGAVKRSSRSREITTW